MERERDEKFLIAGEKKGGKREAIIISKTTISIILRKSRGFMRSVKAIARKKL